MAASLGSFVHGHDERFVDLDFVDGKAFEVGEGGVAGSEVVDGEADAELGEGFEDADVAAFVFHDPGFGDFEGQPGGWELVVVRGGVRRCRRWFRRPGCGPRG